METKQFSEQWKQNIHTKTLLDLITNSKCMYSPACHDTMYPSKLVFEWNNALVILYGSFDINMNPRTDVLKSSNITNFIHSINTIWIETYDELANRCEAIQINKDVICIQNTNIDKSQMDYIVYKSGDNSEPIHEIIEITYDQFMRIRQLKRPLIAHEIDPKYRETINYSYFDGSMVSIKESIDSKGMLFKQLNITIASEDNIIMQYETHPTNPSSGISVGIILKDEENVIDVMNNGSLIMNTSFKCDFSDLCMSDIITVVNPKFLEIDCYKTLFTI